MANQNDVVLSKDSQNTKSCIRVDLHCHSIFSNDSILTLESIIERAESLGLWGVAITDHNRLPDPYLLRTFSGTVQLIPGCEISTTQGHLLAFGIHTAPASSKTLTETIDQIRGQGGIPIFSHPFRVGNGVGSEMIEAFPDVLFEGMNGRSWMKYNRKATALGKKLGRKVTGGSDAHDPLEVGKAWTEFSSDVLTIEDLLVALRRGEVHPGGTGLSFSQLVYSKLKGTIRWIKHYLGKKQKTIQQDSRELSTDKKTTSERSEETTEDIDMGGGKEEAVHDNEYQQDSMGEKTP